MEDPDRRQQFCEWFLHKCDEREDFQDSIFSPDEAKFELDGTINRYNYVYWANKNPNIVEEKTVNLPGVAVWCGCVFQSINWVLLLRRDSYGSDFLQMLEIMIPRHNDLVENEN